MPIVRIEIADCTGCPYAALGINGTRKLICSNSNNRVVAEDYNKELPTIPDWCPILVK